MEITQEFLNKLSSEVNVIGWNSVLQFYQIKSKDKYETVKYIKTMLDSNKNVKIGYNPTKTNKKITNTKIVKQTKKSIPESEKQEKKTTQKKSTVKTSKVSFLAYPRKNKKYTYKKKIDIKKTTGIKYYIERFLLFCFSCFCIYEIFLFLKFCQNNIVIK
jgi:hypothetical protein